MSGIDEQLDTNLTPKKRAMSKKNRQKQFLSAYAKHANVWVAARAAGISRQLVYVWLEKDEPFSFAYNAAKEDARDCLRAEIYRRAVLGVEEPVYQAGNLVGTVRKYSDLLLIFHSKALMPEYREKSQLDLNATMTTPPAAAGTINLDMRNATTEELQKLRAIALEMKSRERGTE